MSDPELFVDGLLNVTLVKGLVRVDLFSLSATETQKDGQPTPQFRQRLVMHPQSLVEIMKSLQVAINALTEKGVLNLKLPSNDLPIAPPVQTAMAPQTDHPAPAVDETTSSGSSGADADASPLNRPRSRNFPSTMHS
jgi:hypothetical protein